MPYLNNPTTGLPSTLTADANGNLTFTARWIQSTNGAASAPAHALTGTWFTGGTATTTKPQLLIEPAGTTSTNWSTAGTGLGINAPSGFTGNLLALQAAGGQVFSIGANGQARFNSTPIADVLYFKGGPGGAGSTAGIAFDATGVAFGANVSARIDFIDDGAYGAHIAFESRTGSQGTTTSEKARITTAGNLGIGTTTPTALLDVNGNTIRLRTARTPASATATGSEGDHCWDASYIYICTATNTWKRAAIATW